MRDDREPLAGDVWKSRDPRDHGLKVQVLGVSDGRVVIQRFRKSSVRLDRWHREYMFLRRP